MSDNILSHVGVLGMRWGRRRAKQNAYLERHGIPQPKNNLSKYKDFPKKINDARKASAKKALEKDIADLDKHGMKDHADALRGNLKKMNEVKAKVEKVKVGDKKMSYATQMKVTMTTAAVASAIGIIGTVLLSNYATKAGSYARWLATA